MNELKKLPRIIRQCRTIGEIPTSYKVSLTYEEQLMWFCRFLEEEVIPVVNNNSQVVQELKTYVEEYFDNLDVQDEINNKLEAMAESGELEEIIAEYINANALICFDTVADLQASTNLVNGSYVKTLGYYAKNDGGGNIYVITNESTNDIRTIEIANDLYAVSEIFDDTISAKQYGCYLDKTHDDLTILQNIINFAKTNNFVVKLDGIAYVSNTLNTKGVKIIGIGKLSKASSTYTSSEYGYIGWDYLRNENDGALITYNDYKNDILKTGSGITSDTANPILQCNIADGHFDLENIVVCGWLRNSTQEGILSTYESNVSYINGEHHFKNVNVFNCGSNGIHLQNLETTKIENLSSNYNFGHGLYLEGVSGIDTPFEYVIFEKCSFGGNKLDGFYAKNCYRKQVQFNNCSAGISGLYRQLGITVPTDTTQIKAGFKVEGKESSSNATREILEFNNCYGEEVNKLIDLSLYGEGTNQYVANKISIKDCLSYPTYANNNNCLLYLDTYYTDNFTFVNNFFNGNKSILISARSNHIIPLEVDYDFYTQYTNIEEPTLHTNLTRNGASIHRYGNKVIIQMLATATDSIAAWSDLLTNIVTPDSEYFGTLYINGVATNCFINTNRKITCDKAIASGDKLFFVLDYFANAYVSK